MGDGHDLGDPQSVLERYRHALTQCKGKLVRVLVQLRQERPSEIALESLAFDLRRVLELVLTSSLVLDRSSATKIVRFARAQTDPMRVLEKMRLEGVEFWPRTLSDDPFSKGSDTARLDPEALSEQAWADAYEFVSVIVSGADPFSDPIERHQLESWRSTMVKIAEGVVELLAHHEVTPQGADYSFLCHLAVGQGGELKIYMVPNSS